MTPIRVSGVLLCLVLAASWARAGDAPATLDFNRDVHPILSETCFACHGPDPKARKADLRLDTKAGVFQAVEPGKLDESELYQRLISDDPNERMPPPKSGRSVTPRQVETIKRWIEQGAEWKGHWSYLKPTQPVVPSVHESAFLKNEIDRFILAKLEERGLTPAPEADRATLVRRLSFDLTGLPPAPEEVAAFERDQAADAYERLVDRMLASPHFGERMAIDWLDLVRYADSAGYHSDNPREVSLYRDYVIKAFNDDKRFDQFTIEQLAGDLLPNPTDEQKVASGYNRLLQTTEEGGAQAKEYTAKYAADRVRNVSSVWLASTIGCSECHDHKYDPFATREFYRFEAFFADIKEAAVGRQEQVKLPSPEQAARERELDSRIAVEQKTLATSTPDLDAAQADWEKALAPKDFPKPVAALLAVEAAKRTEAQNQELAAYYRSTTAPLLGPSRQALAELQKQKDALRNQMPSMLISQSVAPRTMRVLPRGNWLDDSGPEVEPAVPAALGPLAVPNRRLTRLDLAQWLVAKDNPLVARVYVNRLWKLAFGQGLVTTLDDFGSQGAWPTHPHLLDWLAVEFIESGWDVKPMVRRLVLSGAYRQSSLASGSLRQRDPSNRWLARQGRFRIDAEMVRDNALAISGLLVRQVGGPSVKPYQPGGYWAHLNFPRRDYVDDHGPNEYRRGLYTWWQRSFLHPSLLAFDASTREECTVQRPRSNTPLQALVLLNDPTYVEAARAFGERTIREGGKDVESRIQRAYRLALARPARPSEVELLGKLVARNLDQFRSDRGAAADFLRVGDRPAAPDLDPAELAAWTSIARVVLNLHETITRN